MERALFKEQKYQLNKLDMKTKTSILVLTNVCFILLISCCLFSCNIEQSKQKIDTNRKYQVQLSNWVGSEYYKCDSVIWITDSHFKLLNKGNKEPFIDIIVPKEVVVRIFLNSN